MNERTIILFTFLLPTLLFSQKKDTTGFYTLCNKCCETYLTDTYKKIKIDSTNYNDAYYYPNGKLHYEIALEKGHIRKETCYEPDGTIRLEMFYNQANRRWKRKFYFPNGKTKIERGRRNKAIVDF